MADSHLSLDPPKKSFIEIKQPEGGKLMLERRKGDEYLTLGGGQAGLKAFLKPNQTEPLSKGFHR